MSIESLVGRTTRRDGLRVPGLRHSLCGRLDIDNLFDVSLIHNGSSAVIHRNIFAGTIERTDDHREFDNPVIINGKRNLKKAVDVSQKYNCSHLRHIVSR